MIVKKEFLQSHFIFIKNACTFFFVTAKDEKSTSKVLRENRGDLFVGLLYTMEASGPFVAIRHLLQLTNKAQYFLSRKK